MKKVLAIACLLVVLTLAAAAMASAQTQPNWRFYLKADNGLGGMAMAACTIGVQSGAKDGFGADGTVSDTQDGAVSVPSTKNTRGAFPVFGSKGFGKDVKSNRHPLDPAYNPGQPGPNGGTIGTDLNSTYWPHAKTWDLRVFQLPTDATNQNAGVIRLSFQVVNSTMLPPAQAAGSPLKYWLRMMDNKGVTGAPDNGAVWSIPIPTGALAANSTWFTLTLPAVEISATNVDAAMAEGYQMQFIQTPEPSSLLALGAGLMGLAGFASRRRRS